MTEQSRRSAPDKKGFSDEVLQGLRSDDPKTWSEMAERLGPSLLKVANTIVGPDDAEDVVQDTWIRAYRDRGKIYAEGYIFNALNYAAIDHLRKVKRIRSHEQIVIDDGGEESEKAFADDRTNIEEQVIERMDAMERVKPVFAKVPEVHKAATVLSILGISNDEIAEITGVREATVKTRINRGFNYMHGNDRKPRKRISYKKKPRT